MLITLFAVAAGVAALLGMYRLLAGPSATDRAIGLDLLFSVAIVLSLIAARMSERTVYLDVAIALALLGFVATLAWARLIHASCTEAREEET